ncbi:MAG: hypothetical protein IPO08_22235 [Xanthomonadales bacterium]|nr:hypothetical protein [Xanthomonadales bacterium]
MSTIKLTKRQAELLYMDTYCEYGEDNNPIPELKPIRDEIKTGRVTVNKLLIDHLTELADRDQEPTEQRVYRGLLKKAKEQA